MQQERMDAYELPSPPRERGEVREGVLRVNGSFTQVLRKFSGATR
jgi:hypothetical protein